MSSDQALSHLLDPIIDNNDMNVYIIYTKLLRPLSKAVLTQLQTFVLANKKKHWFTIYLVVLVMNEN